MIVETEVSTQRLEEIGAIGEVAGVDEFVLQIAPEPLDENVGLSLQLQLIETR
jgi:hypothetical protein